MVFAFSIRPEIILIRDKNLTSGRQIQSCQSKKIRGELCPKNRRLFHSCLVETVRQIPKIQVNIISLLYITANETKWLLTYFTGSLFGGMDLKSGDKVDVSGSENPISSDGASGFSFMMSSADNDVDPSRASVSGFSFLSMVDTSGEGENVSDQLGALDGSGSSGFQFMSNMGDGVTENAITSDLQSPSAFSFLGSSGASQLVGSDLGVIYNICEMR
jgi:hypothetical protein